MSITASNTLVGPNSSRGVTRYNLESRGGGGGGACRYKSQYWPVTDISVVVFMLILSDLKTVLVLNITNSAWVIYSHLVM